MFNLTQTCCCTKYNINTKKKVFIVAVSGPFYNVTGLQFPLFKPKLYITSQIANKCAWSQSQYSAANFHSIFVLTENNKLVVVCDLGLR